MEISDCTYNFSQKLCGHPFIKSSFSLKHGIELPLRAVLKNQIEVIIIFIVIVELDYMFMVKIIHDFNLKLNLLY